MRAQKSSGNSTEETRGSPTIKQSVSIISHAVKVLEGLPVKFTGIAVDVKHWKFG